MREPVTYSILLLKYQKQAIIAALNGEGAFSLLPTALRKLWIFQVLRDTSLTGNKVPDQEFY